MPLQPFGRGQPGKSRGEGRVNFIPNAFQIGSRERLLLEPVWIRQKHRIEFRVQSFPESEKRQQCIVDSSQMTPKIDQPVLSGSNLLQELLLRKAAEELVCTFNILVPTT